MLVFGKNLKAMKKVYYISIFEMRWKYYSHEDDHGNVICTEFPHESVEFDDEYTANVRVGELARCDKVHSFYKIEELLVRK